ncbi:hypothetical protein ACH4E7_41880 [Kitasatospora sp. NPDC018058]|uniref:hypothetical protein n=1 Tax=Kitasatospora sp. NPDC018058 TaxID=3364025 RepID=UPI0037BF9B28
MKRILRRAAGTLVVAAVTVLGAPPALAAAAPAAPDASGAVVAGGFTPAKLPVSGAVLSSGVQLDRHTTWAAGYRIHRSGPRLSFEPVVVGHDDRRGPQWTELPTPAPGFRLRANTVAGSSTHDAWLFGDREPTTGRFLAEHWDGAAWTSTSIEQPPGELYNAYLLGSSAPRPDSAWTVGGATVVTGRTPGPNGGTSIETRTTGLIEHWDGTAWHRMSADGIDGNWLLNSVTEIARDDVWAVGNTAAPDDKPVLLHYDGRAWSRVGAPAFAGLAGEYQSVAAHGPKDVWVVGRAVLTDKDRGHPLVAHFDGRAWTTVPAPEGVAGRLWSVSAVPGGMAAVGWDPGSDQDRPLGFRYTDGRWQTLDLSVTGYENVSYLAVVAAPGGRLTALGAGGTPKSPDYQPLALTGRG